MEEKNEVLLKFAGFTWDGFWVGPNGFTFGAPWPGPDEAIKESDWKVITGPDLLHSLDAQAKWLWPKLDGIELEGRGNEWSAVAKDSENVYWQKPVHDSPAEACAEAVLALLAEQVPA